jgi:hypothetical protein
MKLYDTELGGLLEHTDPGCRVELLSILPQLKRVAAIRALQRTPVCDLGQEREWSR